MTPTPAPPRATRREWVGLAVIALPCLVYAMDLTVLNLAVPALSEDLAPSATELLWIVDIYGFLVAGALITMGTLGDRIGRRRLLLIGAAAFAAASVLAAFASSPGTLIAARALLGIAGATLAPSTLSLIRTMFQDPGQRTTAIGVWVASYSAGAAVGPLIGGAMLELFWWGSVFLIGVPVMLLLLAVGPRLLPEASDPDAGRVDIASAALSLAAVLAVIFGLKEIAEDGFRALPAAAIAVGLVLALVFARRQSGLADPLIDLRLFRIRAFSAALVTNLLGFFAAFGAFLFTAQYLQLVVGLSPLEAGLWSLPAALAFVAGAMLTPVALRRMRVASLMGGGLLLAAAGFAALTQVDGLALLVVGSTLYSLGLAPVAALGADLVVGAAPPERVGAASGISETSAELGGALGIAMLGAIGAAVYRNEMAGAVPAGVPAGAAETSRDTASGAVTSGEQLGGTVGADLVDAGREAFTHAFQVSAVAAAVILALTSLLALLLLRDVDIDGGATDRQADDCPDPTHALAAA